MKNSFIWLMALVMSLALVSCKGNEENNPDDPTQNFKMSLITILIDSVSQPMLVGGYVDNYNEKGITRKGVIVSKDESEMTITASTTFETNDFNSASGVTMNHNTRYIDCSNIGNEEYITYLRFLDGNQRYYVRAFVVMNDKSVIYGDIKEIKTQAFVRNMNRRNDVANVFYLGNNNDKNLYSLFDLITDEIIDPQEGFYYSTNENPTVVEQQIGTSYNTCYKFLTEWNYRLWYCHNTIHCDKDKIVSLPQMSYSKGKVTISAAKVDVNKELTFYYSVNSLGHRPEKFTSVYTKPISAEVNSVIYCYAISSDGYISYTNAYKVIK